MSIQEEGSGRRLFGWMSGRSSTTAYGSVDDAATPEPKEDGGGGSESVDPAWSGSDLMYVEPGGAGAQRPGTPVVTR